MRMCVDGPAHGRDVRVRFVLEVLLLQVDDHVVGLVAEVGLERLHVEHFVERLVFDVEYVADQVHVLGLPHVQHGQAASIGSRRCRSGHRQLVGDGVRRRRHLVHGEQELLTLVVDHSIVHVRATAVARLRPRYGRIGSIQLAHCFAILRVEERIALHSIYTSTFYILDEHYVV